jgi:predicted enzyme related to lactoylglutathione lyase
LAIASWGCTSAFITLASVNVEALVSFYSALLNQLPQPYQRDRYAEFHLQGLKLAIFKPRPDQAAQFGPSFSSPASLCFEVVDLEAAIAHLVRCGYPPRGPIMTASHGREVYAYDTDGNRLILYQRSGPHP